MRPAETSRTKANATSATTNMLRVRWREPAEELLPPSFKESVNSTLDARNAGARPNIIPVRIEIASVNAKTRPSIVISLACGYH
jgi:hypothetical protein